MNKEEFNEMCRINDIEQELIERCTQYQHEVDKLCGKGEWKVIEYKGHTKPVILQHKCGYLKRLTRANTFTVGGKTHCKQCNTTFGKKAKMGRPRLNFDDLNEEIKELTKNDYELIELNSSIDILVNHKKCDLPPFKTNPDRFFRLNHRCPCKKRKYKLK